MHMHADTRTMYVHAHAYTHTQSGNRGEIMQEKPKEALEMEEEIRASFTASRK